MKSTFARRISILLVLAMVLAMLPVAAMAADTATTVYFENNWQWTDVRVHYWGAEESAWPGVAMTDTGKLNGGGTNKIFSAEIPAGCTGILFTGIKNDGSGALDQSPNIADFSSDVIYYMNWVDGNVVESYPNDIFGGEEGGETEAPVVTEPVVVGNITLYIDAVAAGYVAPYAWAWGAYGNAFASWPGQAMTEVGNGVYSISIREDSTHIIFSNSGNPQTANLEVPGDGYIWNGTEFVDYASYTPVGGEVVSYDYYVAGTFNSWNNGDANYGLTATDGIYSITFAVVAGAHAFKITNGTWNGAVGLDGNTAGDAANITFEAAVDGDVTVTFNPADNTYTITGSCLGEAPEIEINAVNVKGTIPGLDWDAESTAGAMTLVDGIYTITIPAVPASVEGGEAYAFKVMVNNSWDTAYPASNWNFYLNAECDVTITFDPATETVEIQADGLTNDAPPYDGEDPIDPPAGNYYVAGTMNGWSENNADYVMTAGENGIYTYTFTNLAMGNYSLKVTDGTWDHSWTAAEGSEYLASDGNLTFTVTATCDVVVTFDGTSVSVAGNNVTAKAPEELVIDKVLIAGGVAGDSTADPGNMFNGLIWAVGEDITVNKLYDNEDGIYTITFSQVLAGSYEFKFVVNDSWDLTYATGLEVTSGVEETAYFAALGNSTVVVTEDGSKVTFVLDLSGVVYTGDNAKMTVTVEAPASIDENVAPEQIVIGDNEFAVATGNREPVTAPYTATYTGTLYIYPTAMTVINWMGELDEVPSEAINMQFGRMYGIVVDGVTVWGNQVEVVEGQTYQIGILDSMGGGCEVTLTVCSGHNFVDDTCSVCGYVCTNHNWDEGTCLICGTTCAHETWDGGWCTNCSMQCQHSWTYTYTKNSTHKFTCSGICGCEVSIADTDGKKFAINSAAPLLSDDIVMKYSTTVPAGFEEAYMVFDFNGESFYTFEYEVATNGRYEYKFPGINPQKMGDNICATLYATIDGVQVYVQIANYSMVKNCDNQLKKSSLDAKTRTMLSDVLMYGEKAQIVTNYKTDVLVTSLLSAASTLTPSTYPESLDSSVDMQKRTGTKDDRVQFTGVTLSLGSKMAVRVAVTCTDTSLFTYKVTISGREYTYTGEDLVPVNDGSDGKYYLFFNQMKATEFGNKITFTCWEGETQISYTIEYSVYTFIYRNMSKVDANTQELLKAIYNYGESTK